MSNKKNNTGENSAVVATGIAGILSVLASSLDFNSQIMKLINACIPPLSIFLSYVFAWLVAKFYPLSIEELRALSRLNAREKNIRKELKKGNNSKKVEEKLKQELDEITLQKCQIGKIDIVVDETDK